MDPRETLAHYLKSHREQRGKTLAALAATLNVEKGWLCMAENPQDYTGKRSVVPERLAVLLDELGLTFAPVPKLAPTWASVAEMICRMEIDESRKELLCALIRVVGQAERKERTA